MKLTIKQLKQIIKEELVVIREEIDFESLEYLIELIRNFHGNYKDIKDKKQLLGDLGKVESMLEAAGHIYHFVDLVVPNAPQLPGWFDMERLEKDREVVAGGDPGPDGKTKDKIRYEAAFDGLASHAFILRDYFVSQIIPHIEKMRNKDIVSKMDFTK